MRLLKSHYRLNSPRDTLEDLARYGRYSELCEVSYRVAADYSTFLSIEDFVFDELALIGATLSFDAETITCPKKYSVEDHIAIKQKEIGLIKKIKQKEGKNEPK